MAKWIMVNGKILRDQWQCSNCGYVKKFGIGVDSDYLKEHYPQCPECKEGMFIGFEPGWHGGVYRGVVDE